MAVRSEQKEQRTCNAVKPLTRSTAPPIIVPEVRTYPFPPPTTPLTVPLAAVRTPRKRLLKRWHASVEEQPHQQLLKRLKYAEQRLESVIERGKNHLKTPPSTTQHTVLDMDSEDEIDDSLNAGNDGNNVNNQVSARPAVHATSLMNERTLNESRNDAVGQRNKRWDATTQRLHEIRARMQVLRETSVNRKS